MGKTNGAGTLNRSPRTWLGRTLLSSAWLPVVVTLLGLGLTARAVQSEFEHVRLADEQRFGELTERLKNELNRRIAVYRAALIGLRSLFAASVHVERNEFAAAADARDLATDYPGVLGLGYIRRVPRAQLEDFLRDTRADNAPAFKLQTKGEHDPLMVMEFIEPLGLNFAAQGFDIASERKRREAAERSVRAGEAMLTEKIALIQASRSGPGFLYLLPVYRAGAPIATALERSAAVQGWVFMSILAAQAFHGTANMTQGELGFSVYEGEQQPSAALIYEDEAAEKLAAPQRSLKTSVALTIGGQPWTLAIHTTAKFHAQSAVTARAFGLAGGSLSLLLGLVLWAQGAAMRRASARADAMTADVDRLALVAQHSTNGVLITDATGHITWVNAAYTRVTGRSSNEVFGQELAHGIDLEGAARADPAAAQRFATALAAGEAFRGELSRRQPDNSLGWFVTDLQPLRNEHAELTGFVVVRTDVTESVRAKAQLQESQDKLQLLLDSTGEAIYGIDTLGRFSFCNPACARQLGYASPDELLGRSAHDLIHRPESPAGQHEPDQCPIYQVLRGGQGCHVPDDVYVRADGSSFRAEYSLHPQRSGEDLVGAVIAFVDITERLEREEKLRIAQRRAEDASRSKSEFLANMSHEIRTPMTAILGYAELLSEEGTYASTPVQRLEYCNTIKRNGEHLLSIINDILDISKVEAGMLKIEWMDTSPERIVQDVMSTMSVKAQAKGLWLKYVPQPGVPVAIRSDPMRLRQILINLVGNAVKFTEVGGVTLNVSPQGGTRVAFEVVDTGIGLTPEQSTRIFGKFEQADTSTTRKFGGTGLGLQISKRLAEMLGGDIALRSELGKGSSFSVTVDGGPPEGGTTETTSVPALIANLGSPAAAAANDQPLRGARILLAEDGKDNQILIAHHLRKAGAEVRIVDNGRLAVESLSADGTLDGQLVATLPVDVILTDMQMPEMDGYLATRILRAKGCTLPIVALTAHSMSGDAEKCLAAGCDGYAAKPIDRVQLIDICCRALAGELRRPAGASRLAVPL